MYFKAQGARIDKITWGDKQIAKDGFTLGRVANRIAQDKFTLNDQQYSVAVNNNGNSLHGGSRQWNGPFANANWTKVDQTSPNAAFSLRRSLPGGAARGLISRERSSSFSRERASSWDASVSGREQSPRSYEVALSETRSNLQTRPSSPHSGRFFMPVRPRPRPKENHRRRRLYT